MNLAKTNSLLARLEQIYSAHHPAIRACRNHILSNTIQTRDELIAVRKELLADAEDDQDYALNQLCCAIQNNHDSYLYWCEFYLKQT